ncbi:MAG: Na+/H+ antiporter NhaA [Candidatus Kariarchaeaceae archaeon]
MVFLANIGFTFSTFISALAFEIDTTRLEITKLAILIVLFLSGIIGYSLLHKASR